MELLINKYIENIEEKFVIISNEIHEKEIEIYRLQGAYEALKSLKNEVNDD